MDHIFSTIEDAKFHCRTCLIKLQSNADERRKCFDLTLNLELQHFIKLYVDNNNINENVEALYPTVICSTCFRKLQNCQNFLKKAKQSAQVLISLLSNEKQEQNSPKETRTSPLTISTRNRNKQLLLNDVLLETESVALTEAADYDQIEKIDISSSDPFLESETFLRTNLEDESSSDDNDSACKKDNSGTESKDSDIDNDFVPNATSRTKSSPKATVKKKYGPKSCNITRKRVTAAYRCVECKRRFVHKYHYDAHILSVHQGSERPYTCNQCDKTYKNQSALRYHEYVAHKLGTKTFPCNECGKGYKTEASLKYHHLALHMGQKRPKKCICEICGTAFHNTKTLLIHNKAKHDDGSGSEYKCRNCDKLFQSPYTLRYHVLRDHLQEKNYMCAVCGIGFAKKFMLVSHMRTHASDSEKFPCAQCDKRFLSKSDVEKHIRMVHLKIKPHTCEYCGEAFGTQKTLRHHIYIHTGEKPYTCNVCGQQFRQPTAMKTHRNTHFKKLSSLPSEYTSVG